jgi:restriction endonuclease S subunit
MIKDVCEIENSCLEEDSIMIQKNSSIAGKVSLSSSKCDSKNYYYLHNIKKVNKKYLYYLLKNNEQTLRKLSNLTVTTNLSRNNLENFEIPIVSVEIQDKIITQIELYDNIIKQLIEMNNIILSKYSIKDVIDLEKNK